MRVLRDWSLVTGKGATRREGGGCEILPLRKGGGAEKSLGKDEVGGTTSFGVVFML